MKLKYLFIICLFIQAGCIDTSDTQSSARDKIDLLRTVLLDPKNDNVTVVSHRGDWRNAPENSLQAIRNCIDMGVDMVEIDVRKTKDGHLVLMHDATIDRTTNGKGLVSDWTLDSLKTLYLKNGLGRPTIHRIPTLKEAMLEAKGKILVNLDKSYKIFDEVYQILQETGTTNQVIMKGSIPFAQVKKEFGGYLDKVIFMPVIDLSKPEALKNIHDYNDNLHPVAYELVFQEINDSVLEAFKFIQNNNSKVWINSLWASLNGGYEDDLAIEKTDSIYGWYMKNDIKIIQTDRPTLLLKYLREKKAHE